MAHSQWTLAAAAVMALASSPVAAGDWEVVTETDEMTSEVSLAALARAGGAIIEVRCVGSKPAVLLTVEPIVGRAGDRSIQPAYRVDDRAPSAFSWSHHLNGGSLLDDRARQFAQDIQGGTSLRTRIVTWDHETVDSVFGLEGAPAAIAEALKACP